MLKNPILTSRFNNDTFEENTIFREKRTDIGCIYGSPSMLNDTYELNSLYFVMEMNNELNRVEGIGLITNYAILSDVQYNIYKDQNYNRYIYKGKYRLNRDIIERQNPVLLDMFDNILFKGKTHLKRSPGFVKITKKLYNKDICKIAVVTDFGLGQDIVNEEDKSHIIKDLDASIVEVTIKKEIVQLFKTYFR
jgi:hypothetical protein